MRNNFTIFIFVLLSNLATAQVSKTLNASTAGTLTTLLTTTEKTAITNLTVTGDINASDIKCMCYEMPSLISLDISNVNIQSYEGSNGTSPLTTSYLANELPPYSFYIYSPGNGKTSLKDIVLPNSITSIGRSAFQGCTGLTSITFPKNLSSIGFSAFCDCHLSIINITSITPPTFNNSFNLLYESTVYVPVGTFDAYNFTDWKFCKKIIESTTTDINGLNNESKQISIYPNPVKNELKIDFENGSTFEILNLTGQVIYKGNLKNNTTVQTTDFSTGVYVIKFKSGKHFEYKKMIKE